jgi:hypothetical protein
MSSTASTTLWKVWRDASLPWPRSLPPQVQVRHGHAGGEGSHLQVRPCRSWGCSHFAGDPYLAPPHPGCTPVASRCSVGVPRTGEVVGGGRGAHGCAKRRGMNCKPRHARTVAADAKRGPRRVGGREGLGGSINMGMWRTVVLPDLRGDQSLSRRKQLFLYPTARPPHQVPAKGGREGAGCAEGGGGGAQGLPLHLRARAVCKLAGGWVAGWVVAWAGLGLEHISRSLV